MDRGRSAGGSPPTDRVMSVIELMAGRGATCAIADPRLLDVLAEVVEHLAEDPTRQTLRERVLVLLGGISGRPYGAADLDSDDALPVSYLVAPVFAADGRAAWELQIGPLRSAASRGERAHYIEQLTRTARELDGRTGVNT